MPLGISRNLIERIVSAVLLLPPVLGSVYMGGWWFVALLMLGGVLMATEWVKLTSAGGNSFGWLLAMMMVAIVSAVQILTPSILDLLLSLIALVVLGSLLAKYSSFKPLGWWIVGIGYVALPLVALWWLREVDGMLVLWVFLIVWATDIGGYFAGKGIGGPKLAPQVSPKKTWAGLLGGMALSVVVSIAMNAAEPLGLSLGLLVLLSAGFAVWSQVGDLVESGVKRSFGVKDSGGLIPGHGGLLDRVDGLVFVAPAVALVVLMAPNLLNSVG